VRGQAGEGDAGGVEEKAHPLAVASRVEAGGEGGRSAWAGWFGGPRVGPLAEGLPSLGRQERGEDREREGVSLPVAAGLSLLTPLLFLYLWRKGALPPPRWRPATGPAVCLPKGAAWAGPQRGGGRPA
jgi:hypothetical protein